MPHWSGKGLGLFLKYTIYFLLMGAFLVVPMFCCPVAMAPAADEGFVLPRTDRRTGEEFFVAAYRSMTEGHYAQSLSWLEEAMARDPYLIEYYLLRGYCLSHLGDLEGALESLGLYLGVRKNDPLADGLRQELEELTFVMEHYLAAGNEVPPQLGAVGPLDEALGLRPLSLPGMGMPGRPYVNRNLMTFTDRDTGMVRIYRFEKGEWLRVYEGEAGPVIRVLPLRENDFALFFADGTMTRGVLGPRGLELEEKKRISDGRICDADLASGRIAVVADRVAREILFVDCQEGKVLSRWCPDAPGFEPVSLAVLGPLVAVADRGGHTVRVFDAFSGELLRVHDMQGVRAVAWLDSGHLLAVSEEGGLDLVPLGSSARPLTKSFPEAWFLFRDRRGEVVLTDTRLYRSLRVTPGFDRGFLALREPVFLELQEETPLLSVRGVIIHPFGVGEEAEAPLFQGVWGGELLDVKGVPVSSGPTVRVVRVPSEEYPRIKAGEELPYETGILLVDMEACRQRGTEIDLRTLVTLALVNGLPVYFLAGDEMPTLEEVRVAELTGGDILFRDEGLVHLEPARTWDLYLQAMPGIALPGDPEDGGLYVRGNLGSLEMENRLPLWTALLPVEVLQGTTSADLYGTKESGGE